MNGYMENGDKLTAGQCIKNTNGNLLSMEADGNLVVYQGSSAVHQAFTLGNSGAFAKFQADGNFVVYALGGVQPKWGLDPRWDPT